MPSRITRAGTSIGSIDMQERGVFTKNYSTNHSGTAPVTLFNTERTMDVELTSDGKEVKILAKESGTISQVLVNPEEPYVFTGTELFRFTPDFTNKQIIVCYIPSVYAGQLKTGMKLKLYPTSVDTQKSGHMEAEIASIGEFAADNNNMGYVLGFTNGVAQQFLSQGPVVEVVCKIKEDSSTKSGFWWSSRKGKNVELTNGTFVTAKIITDESAPITKLIGNLKEKAEG